jgi:hypothetical protein
MNEWIEEIIQDMIEFLKKEIEDCERLSREAYALGDTKMGAYFKEMAEWRKEDLNQFESFLNFKDKL